MEVNVDIPNLISELDRSRDSLDNEATEEFPETPKPIPMAFTIDFGSGKSIDKSRLEHLAKQSQARHQRVQSMSASLQRTSPTAISSQKPPMSAKLPRKTQGYNSEGYFSSDQEDSLLSGSVKLRQSPLALNNDSKPHSFASSPVFDKSRRMLQSPTQKSKSPIVDSIMSRSDILPSRQGLNLPLKNPITGSYHDIYSPSYNTSYHARQLNSILDQSPDGMMLTDISSPDLDIMTPDNGASSPENKSPKRVVPDLFKKCIPKNELEILEDFDKHSNSSAGTYTIEADYTEEQKARMSIDRTFGVDLLKGSLSEALRHRSESKERDPELILDAKKPISPVKRLEIPKVSNDKNILEVNCIHGSTENLATQTSKQIKSTRSYLEKIKNRVRTISEKTFQKSPSKPSTPQDEGSFTLVTSSGVLAKPDPVNRRLSLSRSQIDKTDYVHRLSRESSVPVSLLSGQLDETTFESTVLRNAQTKLRDDSGIGDSPEQIVGRLSHLSLNRCKGDQTWIQDWAESVKKYNYDTLAKDFGSGERPPVSPRHQNKSVLPTRGLLSSSVSKIPSPVSTAYHSPRGAQDSSPDTASYLLKTQTAITNLQAKLSKNSPERIPPILATSLISEKTAASRLPVSQLSRSNSLNYRLKRKGPDSPLRSPGNYVITGSTVPASTKLLLAGASRSLDADTKYRRDSNMNSPTSERTNSSEDKTLSNRNERKHTRHRSFDGRSATDYFNCDNAISLKTVLKNNAFEAQSCRIESNGFQGDRTHARHLSNGVSPAANIKRSSSFNQVNRNNNYIRNQIDVQDLDYSDESDYTKHSDVRNRTVTRRDRLVSAELKSAVGSSKCPNTPELTRKFGPGLVRTTVRPTNKGAAGRSAPARAGERETPCQGKLSDAMRQDIVSRLTKSRSSTREMQPKKFAKGADKPNRQRSASSLARELEYSNWKKRSSYDPMAAAARGSRSGISPCHSSPVHRSQSFHSTNLADLNALDYSSEDEQALTGPSMMNVAMVSSTHSEILRPNLNHTYHVAQPTRPYRRETDKRKTFILDNAADSRRLADKRAVDKRDTDKRDVDKRETDKRGVDKRGVDKRKTCSEDEDKRKTFVLDSDTNSTTNGSSPRNSSIFSHEKASLTTGTSDTEGESGTESAPVVMRTGKRSSTNQANRHSGDYSVSSTASASQQAKRAVQPRYLDISKYKADVSAAAAGHSKRNDGWGKGSARRIELEQKKAELEKWKRRASYDPRKSAAAAKTSKPAASSVLRSQSFHGPVTTAGVSRYLPSHHIPEYGDDYTSDNDF